MSFFLQVDGLFHLAEQRDHSCAELLPTIKKRWVFRKLQALMSERVKLTPSVAKNWFFDMYPINVEKTMLSRVMCNVKKERCEERNGFGHLSSF